ncbi:MAG: membrane magnesium transporter-domain-containing protein [Piptocephalis tieghemiana]|nr:MAG: membrane magnesium transporter-domain-containing protein [Piptocephalis tieghemiana]
MTALAVIRGLFSLGIMAPSLLKKSGRLMSVLALLLMIHSAYSTYEHLTVLKAMNSREEYIPMDIIAECLVATALFLLGSIFIVEPFKPIDMEQEMSKLTLNMVDARPSFRTFDHRGSVIFSN